MPSYLHKNIAIHGLKRRVTEARSDTEKIYSVDIRVSVLNHSNSLSNL